MNDEEWLIVIPRYEESHFLSANVPKDMRRVVNTFGQKQKSNEFLRITREINRAIVQNISYSGQPTAGISSPIQKKRNRGIYLGTIVKR